MRPDAFWSEVGPLLGEELLARPGSILYSGLDTLWRGSFYIMGYNPGGRLDVDGHGGSIRSAGLHEGPWSAYEHDCWQESCPGAGACTSRAADQAICPKVHQRRVQVIARTLGRSASEIFSANAIFARSATADALDTGLSGNATVEDRCWSVHQWFLDIVRPELIETLGKGYGRSAFRLLMDRANVSEQDVLKLGLGGATDARCFPGGFSLGEGREELRAIVIGVPHPSRFQTSAASLEEIGEIAKMAVQGVSLERYQQLTEGQRAIFHDGVLRPGQSS